MILFIKKSGGATVVNGGIVLYLKSYGFNWIGESRLTGVNVRVYGGAGKINYLIIYFKH